MVMKKSEHEERESYKAHKERHADIAAALERIEREERVRILYACESGSRAWGFPSRDSDYDVRFLYVRQPDDYLSIFERRDVIEQPISELLDINGWDLRKALLLFRKSNPPLLEWLQSPIIYREDGTVADQIRTLAAAAFSARACTYHYLHMARGNYREYLQGERVKIKKYFYVLRPILACEWIDRYRTMPPIAFEALVEAIVPQDSELRQTIDELLARKKAGDELDIEPRIAVLNDYLDERLALYDQRAAELPTSGEGADERLDALFRSVLREAWESYM